MEQAPGTAPLGRDLGELRVAARVAAAELEAVGRAELAAAEARRWHLRVLARMQANELRERDAAEDRMARTAYRQDLPVGQAAESAGRDAGPAAEYAGRHQAAESAADRDEARAALRAYVTGRALHICRMRAYLESQHPGGDVLVLVPAGQFAEVAARSSIGEPARVFGLPVLAADVDTLTVVATP